MALKTFLASSLLRQVVRSSTLSSVFERIPSPLTCIAVSDRLLPGSQHRRTYQTSHICLKGHSKWSNIKHIKAAQDKLKGSIAQELSRKIQHCLVVNPETDPKLNTELAALIKKARSNNIPNETIQKTIDRVIKMRDVSSITAFLGRGPSNTGIVIECSSLKPHHTKTLLQGIVKKYGFSLHVSGEDLFEHKGKIEANLPEADVPVAMADPENFNLDKFVDIAIEAGAEDVTLEPSEEGPILQFMCGPQDLLKVQKAVGESGLDVLAGDRVYVATHTVPVSQEFLDGLEKLTDKLDSFPDVVKYHFNLELEGAG